MAEQAQGEKTENATPRRREEARQKGQIARSQELGTMAALLSAALVLQSAAPDLGKEFVSLLEASATWMRMHEMTADGAASLISELLARSTAILLPVYLSVVLVSLGVGFAQSGFLFAPDKLQPDWNRLNPAANFKNIFGVQAVAGVVKQVLKIGLVGLVAWSIFRSQWDEMLFLLGAEPERLVSVVVSGSIMLLAAGGAVYVPIAIADYLFERWRFEKSLRMSKEDIRQESKSYEGDPRVKGRILQLGRERAQMLKDLPTADVLVVNPTHRAVALRYDPDESYAPMVIAMGEDGFALRLRAVAARHKVYIYEDRRLAMALLATAKVGRPIPHELFLAVADVLSFVYKRTGRKPPTPGRR